MQIFNTIPFKPNPILTRELIHFNATLQTLPIIYLDSSDFLAEELDELVQKMSIKKLQGTDAYSKDITENFSPGQIIYARAPDDPNVKSTFANNSNGPFQIITSDPITKTVRAKRYGNAAIYNIAYCNINKVAITDLTLDLFTGFLEDRNQRDFSARPKRSQPNQTLRDKMSHLSGKDQTDLTPTSTEQIVPPPKRRSQRHRGKTT